MAQMPAHCDDSNQLVGDLAFKYSRIKNGNGVYTYAVISPSGSIMFSLTSRSPIPPMQILHYIGTMNSKGLGSI